MKNQLFFQVYYLVFDNLLSDDSSNEMFSQHFNTRRKRDLSSYLPSSDILPKDTGTLYDNLKDSAAYNRWTSSSVSNENKTKAINSVPHSGNYSRVEKLKSDPNFMKMIGVLKDMPESQRDEIFEMLMKHPDLLLNPDNHALILALLEENQIDPVLLIDISEVCLTLYYTI